MFWNKEKDYKFIVQQRGAGKIKALEAILNFSPVVIKAMQQNADKTGLNYYYVRTAGSIRMGIWALTSNDAAAVLYDHYPHYNGSFLEITQLITPNRKGEK